MKRKILTNTFAAWAIIAIFLAAGIPWQADAAVVTWLSSFADSRGGAGLSIDAER
jgi:hypothetical protein